jgi:hypothetical protein
MYICSKCSSPTRVVKTMGVTRNRICLKCSAQFTTVEIDVARDTGIAIPAAPVRVQDTPEYVEKRKHSIEAFGDDFDEEKFLEGYLKE